MIQRFYFQEIKSRVDEPRKFIQVIYGPRQVGKTTLIKQVLSNITQPYIFETADDILGVDAMWLRKIWSDARLQYSQHKQELLLVIDEVQKIENWSEVIKKEWDLDTFNDDDPAAASGRCPGGVQHYRRGRL
ncbi:MAG: AAA family ATPase [Muribaculaceae bacterium]|nr:AAA family ATPase [Muribaculaceae bacterium]